MINFCLTNNPTLVNGKWTHKKRLKHGLWLYYDSGVEVLNTPNHWIVFCGILWQGEIIDFIDSVKQNGIFYAIVINKKSGEVQVINDHADSFYLTYYAEGRHFVVTNEIKVYGSSFIIDLRWINLSKRGTEYPLPTVPHPEVQYQSVGSENITPYEGVKFIGAGDVLTLQGWDDFDCLPTITNWFTFHRDIGKLFLDTPKHDYQSALATAKQIISENCKRIKEKYGDKLIHFCSTGVDSLTLQSYLDDVPMYGLYCKEFNQYHEPEDLFKNLYNEHKGTLYYFNSDEIQDILDNQLSKVQKISKPYPIINMMFMHLIDRYELNDRVIVQGSYGDDVFWHKRRIITCHAVHRWGMKDAELIWDMCLPRYGFGGPSISTGTYSKESRIDEMNKYISNPYTDFAPALMAHRYINRLQPSQFMSDQLIIDPYMDLRLWSLLPSSDVATQEASMLDAQIQKDIISDKFKPYINPYTAGADMLYDNVSGFNDKKFKRKIVTSFLQNL